MNRAFTGFEAQQQKSAVATRHGIQDYEVAAQ
jgi:hypothetical protein